MFTGRTKKNPQRPVPVSCIVHGPFHSRSGRVNQAIRELAASIKNYGLLYPILLTGGPKRYQLVAGRRRLLACKRLGWKQIPAIVLDLTPDEAAEISLIENLQRAELNGAERLRAIAQLLGRGSTGSALDRVRRAGISQTEIEAALRVRSISPLLTEALRADLITIDEALAISDADDPDGEAALIRQIHSNKKAPAGVIPPKQSIRHATPKPPIATQPAPPTPTRPAARTIPSPIDPIWAVEDDLLERTAHLFALYREEAKIDFDGAERIVGDVIKNLRASNEQIINIRSREDNGLTYLPLHTIDVTRLAVYAGIAGGMADSELRLLGLGSILHDIAMAQIPNTILAKPGPLSPTEMDTVRKHASNAHAAIANQRNMEKPILDIILQHHERADGSGYPKGLRSNDVSTMARSIHIIDTYVAMTSLRPYRRPIAPNAAMEALMRDTFAGQYDKSAFQDFLAALSLYPIGSCVQLAGGEIAQVIGANSTDPNRPILNILTDTSRQPLPKPVKINLFNEMDSKILKPVPRYEAEQLLATTAN